MSYARKPEDDTPADDQGSIFSQHAAFCSIFTDEKRLRIMWLLRDGERRVNEIAEHLGVSTQNASQHLRLMRDRRALVTRREGQSIYYRISNPKFVQGASLIRQGVIEELNRFRPETEDEP